MLKFVLLCLICTSPTIELLAQEMRTELLESGQAIQVPENVLTVPGLPIVIPPAESERLISDYNQFRSKGYADAEGTPQVDMVLEAIRDLRMNNDPRADSYRDISSINLSNVPFSLGRVPDELVKETSDNLFYMVGPKQAVRIYSNTALGAIYIQEFHDSEIVRRDAAGETIAGYPADIGRMRYPGNRWVTTVLAQRDGKVLFVQVSSHTENEAEQALLDTLMRSLLTEVES